MKAFYIIRSTCIAVLFVTYTSSCVTSFYPLFTPETITTDDKLEGIWKSHKGDLTIQKLVNAPDKAILNMNLSAKDSVFYTKFYIVSLNSGKYHYSWSGGIVRINNQEFISLYADECLDKNTSVYPSDNKGYEYLDTYSFAKLIWKNDTVLEVQFLNGAYIKNTILQNHLRIKYEYDKAYGTFLITESTDAMMQFLEKYAEDKKLYDDAHTITLIRNPHR